MKLKLVIELEDDADTTPLTDALGEFMRETEAGRPLATTSTPQGPVGKSGFAELGIRDWTFEKVASLSRT